MSVPIDRYIGTKPARESALRYKTGKCCSLQQAVQLDREHIAPITAGFRDKAVAKFSSSPNPVFGRIPVLTRHTSIPRLQVGKQLVVFISSLVQF